MSKKLVAYFSASGVTRLVSGRLAETIGADLYEIKPAKIYSDNDLNWMDQTTRATVEQKDPSARPALADKNANIGSYDVIFLGFPIWWYIAPRIIQTFLESYDFSGKTLVLYATSGGSGFGKTADELKPSLSPSAKIVEWRLLNGGPSASDLAKWSTSLNM